MIAFCLACADRKFEETGIGTRAKRGRALLQNVREISRVGGGDGIQTEACHFVGNSSFRC